MSHRLPDKVALITGGARGQGAAEARRFVAEGARVAITDILDAEGEALAKQLGDAAFYRRLDVTQESDWDAAVAETVGYGSEAAFSRAFKRSFGVSPSVWRRNQGPVLGP